MIKHTIVLLVLTVVGCFPLAAQYQVAGDAVTFPNNCIQLTANANNETGQVWGTDKFDLSEPFDLSATLNFGANAMGGEGIAFVLQDAGPSPTSIFFSSLGYGFLAPSAVLEFDTYTNAANGDPAFDHVAFLKDGDANHNNANTVIGPNALAAPNIKDGLDHDFRIFWDPATQSLTAYFDCNLVLNYVGDLSNNMLSGATSVYWGFTAATKELDVTVNNAHQVCLGHISSLEFMTDSSFCRGIFVPLDAGEGNTYAWAPAAGLTSTSTQQVIATPAVTTTYTVTISDGCGLTRTDDVTLTVDSITKHYPTFTDVQCAGLCNASGSFTPAPFDYAWSNGDNGFNTSTLCPGVNVITITDTVKMCSDTVHIFVQDVDSIVLDPLPLGSSRTICIGDSVQFSATATGGNLNLPLLKWFDGNGLQFINNGNFKVMPTVTTTYWVEASDPVFNCPKVTDTFTVFVNPPLEVEALNKDLLICIGDTVNMQAIATGADGGPYDSQWRTLVSGVVATGTANGQPAVPALSPSETTTFFLEVFSPTCNPNTVVRDTVTIRVDSISSPEFLLNIEDSAACPREPLVVKMANHLDSLGYYLEWGDGTADSITGPEGVFHTYSFTRCFDLRLTITSDLCPSRVRDYPCRLETHGEPFADWSYTPEDITRINSEVKLEDRSRDAVEIEWFLDGESIFFGTDPGFSFFLPDSGEFEILQVVKNEFGCVDSVKSTIPVRYDFVTFYVPNAFTPNGDGRNDVFLAEANQDIIRNFELKIYNRLGNLVFETEDMDEGWDGKENGRTQPHATYFYNIKFRDFTGLEQEFDGYVIVVR